MKKIALLVCLLVAGYLLYAQQLPAVNGNYQLASRFSTQKLGKMVFTLTVDPHWLKQSNRFWYEYETTEGKNWYIVDPVTKSRQLLFNKVTLAAKLSQLMKD